MAGKRIVIALAALVVVILAFGIYVAAYLGTGEIAYEVSEAESQGELVIVQTKLRLYRYSWQAALFSPLATMESRLRGEDVQTETANF